MALLQIIALALVAVGAAAVVLTPDPLRQLMVVGIYGISLTFLFFIFQAPDVALSELVISGIGLPLIVLAALRKIRTQDEQYQAEQREKEPG
jgi:energy-converting hydrogenase B subunit D